MNTFTLTMKITRMYSCFCPCQVFEKLVACFFLAGSNNDLAYIVIYPIGDTLLVHHFK